MAIDGVIIERQQPGPSVIPEGTNVSAILAAVPIVPEKLANGKVLTVYNMSDVENKEVLGITKEYDTTNKCTLHRQIEEFFRMAGEGTKLYIMAVAATDIAIKDLFTNEIYAKKLLQNTTGDVRQISVLYQPATGYTPTMLDGMSADVLEAIPVAQAFANWCYEKHRPIHIFLEGRDYGGIAATVQNLREIADVEAGNVSVITYQDYGYAEKIGGNAKFYADAGNALGIVAKAAVSQNIAEVESFNIRDVGNDRYKTVGLSSHHTIEDKESDLDTLDAKGFIIAITYADYKGVYLNDDHTCIKEVKDKNGNLNEAYINRSRTLGEAIRVLYKSLIPEVKKRYDTDPKTGKLTQASIVYLKQLGEDALQENLTAYKNIMGASITIDPNSDLFTGERALKITSIRIAAVGNIGIIKGNINLTTKL